ncbi:MAG: hypothetical protein MZV65_54570 [Chromatiales bacterium]|nr:hypothetical protein [Chromatiales bacterium]
MLLIRRAARARIERGAARSASPPRCCREPGYRARLAPGAGAARPLTCRSPTMTSSTNGGVVALVGPTGVGKTTTVAKLAARCAAAARSAAAWR